MSLLDTLACADKGAAFTLWRTPIGVDGMQDLVHAAVLAANAHNSQPWRFSLSDDSIDVHADLARRLGSFDPFLREMHQSLGCAIENLVQAAAARGLEACVEAMPAALPSTDTLAARVRLTPAATRRDRNDDLVRAIAARHTNRSPYDKRRKLPPHLRDELLELATHPQVRLILFDRSEMDPLAELIEHATERIGADDAMATDNSKWFRFHAADVQRRRDGLTLGANAPSALLAAAGRVVAPSATLANKSWVKNTRVQVETAALLGVIAVPDAHERELAIEVGRLWQRAHLLLTARGIAAQPLNQPVEYADRECQLTSKHDARDALSHLIGHDRLQAGFVFRAGYATRQACPSPRRALADVL